MNGRPQVSRDPSSAGQDGGAWWVRDFSQDSKAFPVDTERWADILPHLSGPPNVSVEVPDVEVTPRLQGVVIQPEDIGKRRLVGTEADFGRGIARRQQSRGVSGRWRTDDSGVR